MDPRPAGVAGLLVAVLAAGCASGGPVVRESTRLEIAITATTAVNPDEKGRAAPIQVRIYELRNAANFEAADYFSLAANDKVVLQGDLLARNEYMLRPGESQRIQRASSAETTAIGVLAGYRELAMNRWRAVQPLADAPEVSWMRSVLPANKARLKVTLDDGGIRVQPID